MKLKQFTFSQFKRMQAFTPVLVVGVLMLTGAVSTISTPVRQLLDFTSRQERRHTG